MTNISKPSRVAIFASGAGSNAKKIIDYFTHSSFVKISLIVCNKPGAGVLEIAKKSSIPTLVIEKEAFFQGDGYLRDLKRMEIDFIVLAGFLWKIPQTLLEAYRGKIVNIHPALLPKYGGKGMYGMRVHEAVLAAGDRQSGITIHYVDEVYDHGAIIFQASFEIDKNETPDELANKVHALEHAHYPQVIERLLEPKNYVKS